ncbi:hypothetical protein [Pseudoalteromonas sp. G4]|uniref:hypothetical protein n=1 Tax=Pseudoalteromonas sp. G4 TaxID=2992761 RepID=UPI00237D693B|nr:hypothetical protein [Pseudoalteromonas sp. G4]MDE3270931.1 hypothetical protein [Pseudoalteromonas sp. G4]
MVFVQSRIQGVKFRIYTYIMKFGLPLLIPFIVSMVKGEKTFALQYLCFLLIVAVLVSVWLMLFNSGKSKIVEYSLELNSDGIHLTEFGKTKSVLWNDYAGYSVGGLPKTVSIKTPLNGELEFGYFVFSQGQRNRIFEALKFKEL